MSDIHRASTTAPVNIAVIKYWGKRDPKLNLPTNSSLSVTLAQSDLRTHTTASCSSSYPAADSLLLNGESQDVSGARTQACFRELRALRKKVEEQDSSLPKLADLPLRIVSENNFPTAAGLASSAAGFAALVRAIANLYELPSSPTDLSRIARQGSGSACRSLFGGYVGWEQGAAADGSDSQAFEVAPASHWPSMRAVILVVSAAKKGVSSTTGMQTTVATSSLFASRASDTVPRRMKEMQQAIQAKDFEAFGKITMMDSNSFHATCLDTFPPIFYLNDVSRAAIKVVESINAAAGKIIAAYTFDAGPNAVVYYLEENEKQVAGLFKLILVEKDGWAGERGAAVQASPEALEKVKGEAGVAITVLEEGVSRVILTGVGEGPVRTEESLIDEKGEPVVSA
ncbi:Diphosphomevalonate decarboxylase [Dothidotthia symphoricarpi CBS 119687]|uniref:Diphosphomevalonate decarboxylase n=1 Tax=Dothidotthia symphoricarpi CBS 119687 TaxID=1392245 RepID=A0A6A6A6I3_9PLEO|nr:Diphosphomevalonate decarboxylase [Dothidotthia symphoricarpi CBS 119687]KAF2127420.1 Diphosphomevalonate decarboxylase [Dothidotthia symphoricarpi CBS 119687]